MPIKVSCECGQTFTAKDELAGQTLLCPKCHQPITIGATAARETQGPKKKSAGGGIADLLDEAGIAEVRGVRCPKCGEGIAQGGVLCVHCGYHQEKGEVIAGARIRKGDADGFLEAAESMMDFAEQQIEYDKVEEKKNISHGTPAWLLFLVLMIVVGFAATMYVLPRDQAVRTTGIAVIALGGLLQCISSIRILIVAFMERLLQGFLSLFVPFYVFYYIISRWRRCGSFFMTFLGAVLIQLLGWGLIHISPMFEPKEARLPTRPGPGVRVAATAAASTAASGGCYSAV